MTVPKRGRTGINVGGLDDPSCQAILAATGAGICQTNAQGLLVSVNDRFCELLDRSREELIGKRSISELIFPDDCHWIVSDTGAPANEVYGLEIRYLRPDNSVVPAIVFANWTEDPRGATRRWVSASINIGERKRSEQALRRSEARLSAIFSNAPVGLSELSLDGQFKTVNNELCKMLGRSRSDLLSMNAADVTHPEDVSHTQASLAKLIETGAPAWIDKRYVRSDGGIVFATSSICRLDDEEGRPETILAVTVDLTERHRMESALLASEERYRTLFNSIDEGFCVMEVIFDDADKPIDYRYLQINPAFEKQAGISGVIGKRQGELVPHHEQFWADTLGRIAVTGESRRFVGEAHQLGRWFDVYAFRIDAPEDRHVAAVFNNITDHVHEKAELEQADRRKNEFMAVLAHELRNPLAAIRSGLQILRMSQGKRESTEHLLELMERQMQQMVRLVDDLLDLSRITQGKVRIQPQRERLQRIIDNAIEGIRPLIIASGVLLHTKVPSEPVEVEADGARLAQVISNLLSNAAKYTDAGGDIFLSAETHDGEVVIKVKDTGTGIPANMLNSIFDAFTQVDNSLARSHGGLGLGLSLAQTLVQLHGGTITAHSEGPGHGSEFIVRLPDIARTGAPGPAPAAAKSDNALGSHRIVVVDDNADAAEALAMMLRMYGNDVEVALSGQQGLSLTEQFHPELLLLDLGMPELDGYEVARRIRSQPWGKSIVVAALTGWGQEEDRQRSRQAGFDHHLVKPVDLGALREMLGRL